MTDTRLAADLDDALLRLVRIYLHRQSPLIENNLTIVQFFLLRSLAERDHTIGDLASLLMVSPSAISGTVERLSEMGLVERRADERDRRLVFVAITAAGRERLRSFEEERRKLTAEIFSKLSSEEGQTFLGLLKKVIGREAGETPTPAQAHDGSH